MKIISAIKWISVLLVITAVACGIYIWKSSSAVSHVKMRRATVAELKSMAELCTLEIHEEVPVRASIGPRHLFASESVNCSVLFDMEKAVQTESGDTLMVELPAPRLSVTESTDAGSYRVIDTWNDNLLGSSHFTTAEENALKARALKSVTDMIVRKGYVARATEEAQANVKSMLEALLQRPVEVSTALNQKGNHPS